MLNGRLFDADVLRAEFAERSRIIRECSWDAEIIIHTTVSLQDVPDYASRSERSHHPAVLSMHNEIAKREKLLHIDSVWGWVA